MLTIQGRNRIGQYLAGMVPNIAQSIAFGVIETAPTETDEALGFEIDRVNIDSTSFDPVTGMLTFSAFWPTGLEARIYEFGLFTDTAEDQTPADSKVLATFSADEEEWYVTATDAPAPTLSGGKWGVLDSVYTSWSWNGSMYLTTTPKEIQLDNLTINLGENGPDDEFHLNFEVGDTNTTGDINLVFMTTESDYYTITYEGPYGPNDAYLSVSQTKGSAVATGNPDWSNIRSIKVYSDPSGPTANVRILYDGLRIENKTIIDPERVMVARIAIDGFGYDTGIFGTPKNPERIIFSVELIS